LLESSVEGIAWWALLLATYQYNIEFRSTHEHSNADGLSRLPLAAKEGESVSTISVFSLSQIEFLPVNADKLRQATILLVPSL